MFRPCELQLSYKKKHVCVDHLRTAGHLKNVYLEQTYKENLDYTKRPKMEEVEGFNATAKSHSDDESQNTIQPMKFDPDMIPDESDDGEMIEAQPDIDIFNDTKEEMMGDDVKPKKRYEISHVEPAERVHIAPEYFYEDGNKLYCRPCDKPIKYKKKAAVYQHLQSSSHLKMVDLEMKYGPQMARELMNRPKDERPKGKRQYCPPQVTADERIALAPESLYHEGNRLFCRPCNRELSVRKKSVIDLHLNSANHAKMVDLVMKFGPQHPPDKPPTPLETRKILNPNTNPRPKWPPGFVPNVQKKAKPEDRIVLCPEHFYTEDGRLFCRPCRLELSYRKKSVIDVHLQSSKHIKNILIPTDNSDQPIKSSKSRQRDEEREVESRDAKMASIKSEEQARKEAEDANQQVVPKPDQTDTANSICPYCGKSVRKTNLRRHVLRSHTPGGAYKEKEEIHICATCGKVCTSRLKYKIHMENTHEDYVWRCKLCDREFNTFFAHRRHIPTHSLNKPFKCWICDYASAFRGNVALHAQKTHKQTENRFSRIIKTGEMFFGVGVERPYYVKYYKPGGVPYTGKSGKMKKQQDFE